MRSVVDQFDITQKVLLNQIKKLKTSVHDFEDLAISGSFDYQILVHLQDDALSVSMSIEKYLLLQLMRDTNLPQ